MKRDRWTEADVLGLPNEGSDQFDRKSGLLLRDAERFLDATAKALSAFANSGGGSLIIGVEDDGTLSGVEPNRGQATVRDWLEQKIPNLHDYPIADFRVHTIEPAATSQIPSGKVIVDVGDSALAPHQSKRDKIYYHRSAGRSLPAPHFYLELLRNRLTSATLEFRLDRVTAIAATRWNGGVSVEMKFQFELKNTGRVAAYKWSLQPENLRHPAFGATPNLAERYQFGISNFPVKRVREGSVSFDDTILPGNRRAHQTDVALFLPSPLNVDEQLEGALKDLELGYRLATEMSPGSITSIPVGAVLDVKALAADVERLLAKPAT
jgi:hypothetical protein